MKKLLSVVLAFVWMASAQAQVKAYAEPHFTWENYIIDGKEYEMEFWNGPGFMVEAMKSNPEAQALAMKAKERLRMLGQRILRLTDPIPFIQFFWPALFLELFISK